MEARNDIPLQSISTESLPREQSGTPSEHHGHGYSEHLQEEVTPPYEATNGENLPPYAQQDPVRVRSTPLNRSIYILFPTALYSCMAIYSWVTLCLLSQAGPIVYNKNNIKVHQYKAAHYLQAIVSVATIPMISAVCAWAAAVFVQNQRDAYSLRLRQVVTLADRAWMDPLLYVRMLLYPSALKRYGSSFLYLAIFIHVLGAITYPVQSLFLSHRDVYVTPDKHSYSDSNVVKTIPSIVKNPDSAAAIWTVRRELQTVGVNGWQGQLWGNTTLLSAMNPNTNWFAQLPANFSTGSFYNQTIPRVNSSAEFEAIPASEFPSNCNSTGGWFYSSYIYPSSEYNLTLEACLATNVSQSPWQSTDNRQDFSEVLYVHAPSPIGSFTSGTRNTTFKITMNTTAGPFELPNYMNNYTAGLLQNSQPSCSYECQASLSPRQGIDSFDQPLVGPLTAISLALFGPGSFADTQQTVPDSDTLARNETGWQRYLDIDAYDELYPLSNLGIPRSFQGTPIGSWIGDIFYGSEPAVVSSAFTQAGFLATKALFDTSWTDNGTSIYSNEISLEQITLPSMSIAGLIVVSVLFGLYMVPMLCLALYAASSRRWTNTLDAFTMLRMGAALGQKDLPLLVGKSMRRIRVLDDLPGVVRDISGPDDQIRQLALGIDGGSPLKPSKRYLAYPGNNFTGFVP